MIRKETEENYDDSVRWTGKEDGAVSLDPFPWLSASVRHLYYLLATYFALYKPNLFRQIKSISIDPAFLWNKVTLSKN